jgi:hypothetical protein
VFAGPNMNPRETGGCNQTFLDLQNHETRTASNSRRRFSRSLLGGDEAFCSRIPPSVIAELGFRSGLPPKRTRNAREAEATHN